MDENQVDGENTADRILAGLGEADPQDAVPPNTSGGDENQSLLDALGELPPLEPSAEIAGDPGFVLKDYNSPHAPPAADPDLAAALDSLEAENLPPPEYEPTPTDENPDPALAVDEMLAAALPDHLGDPALTPFDAMSQPSFQLQLDIPAPQREALKALAKDLSLNLPEGDSPLLTQLTEYQAVALRQGALALGVGVRSSVNFPLPSLSEEEQALGDLALIPDKEMILAEGAPAVTLPKGESEVLVLTELGSNIHLQSSLGLVTAHRSIARRFFRQEEADEKLRKEISRLPTAENRLPASRVEALFREILLELQKLVLQRGGNALYGLRLESFPESSHLDPELEQMRLVAFGTAAIVEKAQRD